MMKVKIAVFATTVILLSLGAAGCTSSSQAPASTVVPTVGPTSVITATPMPTAVEAPSATPYYNPNPTLPPIVVSWYPDPTVSPYHYANNTIHPTGPGELGTQG
jgi:hypothetical protein